ncbi:MAG: hypothetical protein ACYC3I_14575 [Gemmataceae bacterium]
MTCTKDNSAVLTPFLTLPDPLESGEGALDPLGLATLAEQLAEWILPGMTARMHRPRFLTAIAVSAAVCEGLEEEVAEDGKTPAWLVLEWLLVEAFARAGVKDDAPPGIRKATTAREAGIPLGANNYLKAATVFGFHGVYKRLARHLEIVDEDFQAREGGYQLLKVWEREQGLQGQFTGTVHNSGGRLRYSLRSAVEDGLQKGCTDRSNGWQGWSFFVEHLAPGSIGPDEADSLRRLLLDPKGEPRGELFRLITESNIFRREEKIGDAAVVNYLLPKVSADLAARLRAIAAYEAVATPLDHCWDWLRHLSTQAGARALRRAEFTEVVEIREAAKLLRERLRSAEEALKNAPHSIPEEFAELARFFENGADAESLYEALLERHAQVQKAKPPEGKLQWFDRTTDGSAFVRMHYRLRERPQPSEAWRRPYRLQAVLSFCRDLNRGQT